MDENNPQEIIKVGIGFLGDSNVGKTSIIQRFVKGEFNENAATTISVTLDQKFLLINDKKIKCILWDTSGQENRRSLEKVFIKMHI